MIDVSFESRFFSAKHTLSSKYQHLKTAGLSPTAAGLSLSRLAAKKILGAIVLLAAVGFRLLLLIKCRSFSIFINVALKC